MTLDAGKIVNNVGTIQVTGDILITSGDFQNIGRVAIWEIMKSIMRPGKVDGFQNQIFPILEDASGSPFSKNET